LPKWEKILSSVSKKCKREQVWTSGKSVSV